MTSPELTACHFHRSTNHRRNHIGFHPLDWLNRPDLYKIYPDVPPLPLPDPLSVLDHPLTELYPAIDTAKDVMRPDIRQLSTILQLGYGITAERRVQTQSFLYRSAPSAGALYPGELYLASYDVGGLPPGLYHYQIKSPALIPIREDALGSDQTPAFGNQTGRPVRASLFITGVFFRSAWKYRDRAYRYVLLDVGHLVENLLIAIKTTGLSCSVSLDFDDDDTTLLLGLDPKREACLATIHFPRGSGSLSQTSENLSRVGDRFITASRVSQKEVFYEMISEFHKTSCTKTHPVISKRPMVHALGVDVKDSVQIEAPTRIHSRYSGAQSILRRRSFRNYVNRPLGKDKFLRVLNLVYQADSEGRDCEKRVFEALSWGFIINSVRTFDPGFYLVDSIQGTYGKVKSENLSKQTTSACLDQSWLVNTSALFLFMANLDQIDRLWGPRGYRYAMIAAGRLGQTIYLGATASGLGCCGIGAFYDDEMRALLDLNPASVLLYLLAVGPIKQAF